jgi:AP-3 complex subunit delta-1
MNDFEWYIGVLVELVKQCPSTASAGRFGSSQISAADQSSVANAIGAELLNVAVRVKAARPEAAAAAQSLLLFDRRERYFPAGTSGGQDVLIAAAFIAGEYASMLPDPEAVLTSLVHTSSAQLPAKVLTSYLQAVPKVFAALTGSQDASWTSTRRSTTTLFIARVINFAEPLTLHPNLDVQERAVEYLDLMRLASEAVASQQTEAANDDYAEPPLLLTQAIPALFSGMELNPVAPAALRKVPQPEELDLDSPINSNLQMLLAQAEYDTDFDDSSNEVYRFYHDRATSVPIVQQKAAADLLNDQSSSRGASYQDADDETLTPEAIERKKAERRERYRDDPYYIDSDRASGVSTPMHNILRAANGEELDVDAIPVLELQLDPKDVASNPKTRSQPSGKSSRKQSKRHFEIAGDETLDDNDSDIPTSAKNTSSLKAQSLLQPNRPKKSLLEVDSSGLSALSLSHDDFSSNGAPLHPLEVERRQAEDAAMAQALKEVERLRLQMQRAQERVGGDDDDGNQATTVVKRKKPRKKRTPEAEDDAAEQALSAGAEEKKKKKKKKKKPVEEAPTATEPAAAPEIESATAATEAKPKKKKKRQVVFDE